ncbi:MAG: hypothetical protein GW760_03455 [Legionella sp.]|jgi:Mg2+/Co2+ transporter CorB|nr:hypothetical protein [Legionella sp.]
MRKAVEGGVVGGAGVARVAGGVGVAVATGVLICLLILCLPVLSASVTG